MKLKLICLFALILLGAGIALSQQPTPPTRPPLAQQAPPPGNPMAPEAPQPHMVPTPPPGQHAPMSPQAPPPPADPLAQNLFPPELVMQHKQEIGLTDGQKAAIREELIKAGTQFNELQWQMQDEMETLVGLTKGTTVDEQRALTQLDKVLGVEREVKRTQLTVAMRIKNKLTVEQQARLQEIQRSMR